MPVKDLILQLQLKPHPEGGYYRETYRSSETLITQAGTNRNIYTSIYYLLDNEDKSLFHRIRSDELWFFHQGESLEINLLHDGQLSTIILGNEIETGEVPQAKIPANTWFSAKLKNTVGYSLVSCTVSPGFDFTDFELAKRETLIQEFPNFKDIIEEFTL